MSADCEANYLRLCRLLPDIVELAEFARQNTDASTKARLGDIAERRLQIELSTPHPAELVIAVAEQCRYTTTLNVTIQLTSAQSDGVNEAGLDDKLAQSSRVNLQVRLYHDVRLAEVIAFSDQRAALASYEYPNEVMFQPDEKAQQNKFLAEWLSMTLNSGLIMQTEGQALASVFASPEPAAYKR